MTTSAMSGSLLAVFARLGVSDEDRAELFRGSRRAPIVAIRREAARALRAAGYSYPMIGRELGLSHTNVMYLCGSDGPACRLRLAAALRPALKPGPRPMFDDGEDEPMSFDSQPRPSAAQGVQKFKAATKEEAA